ncbi:lytic transglycosylase domain-containing protein [Streptomyces sp. NBC_00316]|uniref:lytic transglycosylase domain-containing protein n=1 Tax=Streptomyces sp. NBC_00316 TaxID=2975710 RepID=UPI002E2A52CE|nr:lytic murein transglycosylase [Streptomyces sp. NBC_00316]
MRFNGTMRRGLGGTAAAVAAMAALTASQAPGITGPHRPDPRQALDEVKWTEVPNDDSYHTELPPLKTAVPPQPGVKSSPAMARSWSEAGIPATVLAAYRKAESLLGRTDPGCRLPWQLLAAIGKVESGQAGGGRVDAQGTTLTPILGPVLNGAGFANIPDTDGGAYDGDATYDRAVGPMQFIPSTWAHWGRDGNGDGRRDPSNIYDAALAAGYYLCAGPRNLSVKADLDRAILSYNHSDTYLRTVLSWLEFYRKGTHPVADGRGPVPKSPGAGGPNEATQPVGGPGSPSDGIVIGPQPTRATTPSSSDSPHPEISPTGSASPDPSTSTDPGSPEPTESGSADPDPGTTPDPDPSTSEPDPGTDPGCPTDTPPPDPADTAGATDSPSPDPSPGDLPCATPSESASAG